MLFILRIWDPFKTIKKHKFVPNYEIHIKECIRNYIFIQQINKISINWIKYRFNQKISKTYIEVILHFIEFVRKTEPILSLSFNLNITIISYFSEKYNKTFCKILLKYKNSKGNEWIVIIIYNN